MKLFYSPFHDFAHKVLVVAAEAGCADDIETVASFPFRDLDGRWVRGGYDTTALTPLGKVPFLALDDGSVLYGSQVVCEFLDARGRRERLLPERGRARFDALRRQTLGDSLFEFAVQLSMEGWREPGDRRQDLYDWLWPKIERILDEAEHDDRRVGRFDMGDVALAQGLTYLDAWAGARDDIPGNPCRDWKSRWPGLTQWLEATLRRPSVAGHYRRDYVGDVSPENHARAVAEVLAARRAGGKP